MSRIFLTSSTAGALFGAALASSGVYLPSVIISQMQLSSLQMLKVFITASASSAVIIALFDTLAISKSNPRPPSPLGLFSRYDGNILGGLLVGLGMALTGACPGTVLVQLATGIRSGWYVLAGGIVGGILYSRPLSAYLERHRAQRAAAATTADTNPTVQSALGLSTKSAVAAYVVLCLGMLGAAMTLDAARGSGALYPLLGGAAIGAAQVATLVLTGNAVGVSTGYEVAGQYFWRIVGSKSGPAPPVKSLYFAGGIVAGALAFSHSSFASFAGTVAGVDIALSRGFCGGLVMVLGARLAGGCTSGHGISGMSMMGISSFVTVACMFAGGMGAARVIG
ncbi:YeeE/YedE family protein [Karstenula rhodostoma CBS 690.94]|uniref:YeeE/YedE family protein n=1 Tax=Karstenula rhodostoma CBS 690.94 TaxID=1392251 RepID=A0A9P4PF89_9PLEO|nr:YeeE/YedE family protein [Karstenula rhodostoma CBS 690.94]